MRTMRKPATQALIGSGLLLIGLVGGMFLDGTVFAASATHHNSAAPAATKGAPKYCQVYEQALANDLNVSESTLEHANIDAIKQTLDQMQRDGQITATEKAQLEQLLQQVGTQPCTHLNTKTISSYLQGDTLLGQELLAAHTQLLSAVATALGLTPTALQAALAAGKTIPQLAAAHKVSVAKVNTAYLGAVKTLLAQAVSSGLITQAQSDAASRMLAHAVSSGHYPLLLSGADSTSK